MKTKSIITIFIGLLWAVGVSGQTYFEANDIRYRIIKEADGENAYGTVSVAKAEFDSYEGEIVIPSMVKESNDKYADSYKVLAIDDEAFMDAEYLTKIKLPQTIEKIGKRTFYGCYNLKEVQIPVGNLKEIPEWAFYECEKLESIALPSSVLSIGDDAFNGCSALKNVQMPGVRKIGKRAFMSCPALETIVFPASMQYLGDWAFAYCKRLCNVKLNSALKSIGDYAFIGCGRLTSLILPEELREIGAFAFAHSGIITIKIPEKIRVIHQGTFDSSALRQITLPSGLRTIDEYAFLYLLMDTLIVPANVEMFPAALKETTFGAKRILEQKAKKFKSIKQPYVVSLDADSCYEYYGDFDCFIKWHSLSFKTVISPLADEQYGAVILDRVNKNEVSGDIIIPDLLEINQNGKITKYIVGEISMRAFYDCAYIQSVKLPGCLPFFPSFSECSSLQSIDFSECEGIHSIPDYMFSGCTKLRKFAIPNTVTSIGEGAFYNCAKLATITIPNSVKSIGQKAFYKSGLEEVVIPDGVDSISEYAFAYCNLKKVTLPSSLRVIQRRAFEGNSSLTNIILPTSVERIGWSAFDACPIDTIRIPANVKVVESGAFSHASNVFIEGDPEKWHEGIFSRDAIRTIHITDDKYLGTNALRNVPSGVVISPRSYEIQRQKEEDTRLLASIDRKKKVFKTEEDVLNYLRSHIFVNIDEEYDKTWFDFRFTRINYSSGGASMIGKIEVVSFTKTSALINYYFSYYDSSINSIPVRCELKVKDDKVTFTQKYKGETRTFIGEDMP